jgi:hypothetical protein
MLMDDFVVAWQRGVRVRDATCGDELRVFVKCLFATFDYPGDLLFTILHNIAQYCTILHNIAQYCTILHNIAQYMYILKSTQEAVK